MSGKAVHVVPLSSARASTAPRLAPLFDISTVLAPTGSAVAQ